MKKRENKRHAKASYEAMISMLAVLKQLGLRDLVRQYRSEKIREKHLMSSLACKSIEAEAGGNDEEAKSLRSAALLAAFLHEAKHDHLASPHADRAFWAHLSRISRDSNG